MTAGKRLAETNTGNTVEKSVRSGLYLDRSKAQTTINFHERLVMELYIRPRRRALDPQQAPPPVVQENPETDLIVPKTNRAGRISRLGSTGKFYCGAQIENSACATSNHSGCKGGICGPTNGCNCLPCMELDIKIRRLPPGFLVNRGGAPCRLQAQSATQFLLSFVGCNPTWYCGRTMPEIRAKCTPSKPCDDCSHMKQVGHIHYAELLSSLNNPSFSAGNSSYAADPTTPRMNRFGRTTRMSWNGKLYCGGPLDLASESEDNVCGPHAGSPCSACMMIDVAVRKLPDGYLINNCGAHQNFKIKSIAMAGADQTLDRNAKRVRYWIVCGRATRTTIDK
ncbi:hypothetical protein BJ742DRAFT_745669 [Cladochytrium replicatum]|nr:hypothetical protein BJ742DRAFT_745669 [Cladochytrium replicatum]